MKKTFLLCTAVLALFALDADAQILHRPLFHRHHAHGHQASPVPVVGVLGQAIQGSFAGQSSNAVSSARIEAPRQVTDDLAKTRDNLSAAEKNLKDLYKKNKLGAETTTTVIGDFRSRFEKMSAEEKKEAQDVLRKFFEDARRK